MNEAGTFTASLKSELKELGLLEILPTGDTKLTERGINMPLDELSALLASNKKPAKRKRKTSRS